MKRILTRRNPVTPQILKGTSVALGFALAGMQFVPSMMKIAYVTAATSPVHMSEIVDPQVGRILDRSCADCHSNNTHWPWYSRLAPVSWIVSNDVSKGRAKLDFSDWPQKRHSANELAEICDAVSDRSMPPRAYTLLHPGAKLSAEDVELICSWTESAPLKSAAPQRQSAVEKSER